jgi:putative transposase
MGSYRRWYKTGAYIFFTVVSYRRRPWFLESDARRWLGTAIRRTRLERPFQTFAMVLLPDHLHAVWKLPDGDEDYATRWRLIKTRFTRMLLAAEQKTPIRNPSRRRSGEQAVWQRRYWERILRDENDLKRHVDYIHYNPVKHGLVSRAIDWPFSTFRRFIDRGEYPSNWGNDIDITLNAFGEEYE